MSNLVRAWTNSKELSDDATVRLLKYIQEKSHSLIPIQDYVFDKESLLHLINFSICEDCLRYQAHDCCEGNSHSSPKELVDRTSSIMPEAIMLVEDIKAQEMFNRKGGFTRRGSTTSRGHRPNKVCMFSYVDNENKGRCAIHKWCLLNDKQPCAYKPYPCSLFPIEGVVMPSGKTFVFCGCKETSGFSMWYYPLLTRICVNYDNLRRALARDTGNNKYLRSLNIENIIQDNIAEQYRPAYIEQETVLRYFVGDEVYNQLVHEMEQV